MYMLLKYYGSVSKHTDLSVFLMNSDHKIDTDKKFKNVCWKLVELST